MTILFFRQKYDRSKNCRFFKHCSKEFIKLLNINDLKNFHTAVTTYFRSIKNDVEIFTNSTVIDKINLIERVVQSFLYKFNNVFENFEMLFSFSFIFDVVMSEFVAVEKKTVSIIREKTC